MNKTLFHKLIRSLQLSQPYRKLCCQVAENPLFFKAPASVGAHANPAHSEEGGLVCHTLEVVEICAMSPGVDMDVLLTAAVWHDYAKIFEYEGAGVSWKKTPYQKLVGHVVGSVLEIKRGFPSVEKMPHIIHCMLSHHGRKEWGSPVEPQTREAFFLHNADMISTHVK